MFQARSPFERLRALLADLPPGAPPIDLTVGGPRHPRPPFIDAVIARHGDAFGPYPPIGGTPDFKDAVRGWLDRRYGLSDAFADELAVLPLSGSREGLFLAAFVARALSGKANPTLLYANPFYQTYPSAAQALAAEPVPLDATPGSVLPDLATIPTSVLDRAVAYYFASPSNPQGSCADPADWHRLFDLAAHHDYFLFADECYSEVYREAVGPPVGALEAARERPEALRRLLVFNSLSKRSNLAGMRVGFVAGHREVIEPMRDMRNQVGPQVPTPLQAAAAAAWRDEAHVADSRRLYDAKFALAEAALGPTFGAVTPPAGFFLWLAVEGDDLAVCKRLWCEAGVRAVPGRYLASERADGSNPGAGHVRLALVADEAATAAALARIAPILKPRREAVPGPAAQAAPMVTQP